MLELNGWFFVLLVLFLSTYFILSRILFLPLLQVFKERESAIDGSIEEAGKMHEEKDRKLAEFKEGLSAATHKAKGEFESLREDGLNKQRELLDAAGSQAMGMVDSARQTLRTESATARKTLKLDAEKYADSVVEKLMKA